MGHETEQPERRHDDCQTQRIEYHFYEHHDECIADALARQDAKLDRILHLLHHSTDPAIQAEVAKLKQSSESLAATVAANQPAP